MPARIVLHKGNSPALVGLCYDYSRFALAPSCSIESGEDFSEIVSVYNNNVESEGFKLFIDRFYRHYIIVSAVNLQSVPVYDGAEVVQFIMSCSHCSFPYETFLQLSVSQKHIYPAVFSVHLGGHCHAYGNCETLSQRAC